MKDNGGASRIRTGVSGFAIRGMASLLSRHYRFNFHFELKREIGAGNEIRTRDPNLGKVVLYQLSYSR